MPSRAELEVAFAHYQSTVRRAVAERDWTLFAGLFTPDAHYNEHAYGRIRGRSAIAEWAVRTMTTFPGNAMIAFPVSWSVIDAERGWVVCEIQNVMPDPGDASLHQSPNLTILHYAGDNLFSYEEDVYNPTRFIEMVAGWAAVAQVHGRLPDDARAWVAKFGGR
ncbi:MAG TPA: nuclear transport factor 2 family protein [Jatrophihabitans sp.]|nr:nuclear transport factor 2 family protein [Jatrophihabitans sp.]